MCHFFWLYLFNNNLLTYYIGLTKNDFKYTLKNVNIF